MGKSNIFEKMWQKSFSQRFASWHPSNWNIRKIKPSKENLNTWRDQFSNMSLDNLPTDMKISPSALRNMKIATVMACAYFAADLAATIVSPFIPQAVPPSISARKKPTKGIKQYEQITGRNLFNKDGLIPDPTGFSPDFDGPAVKTKLPLTLTGIIIVRDKLKSVASVSDRSSNQIVAVRVNDPINPNVIVKEISGNRLIFYNKRTRRKEYIDLPKEIQRLKTRTLPKTGGISQVSENHLLIDRTEVDKALSNLNKVLTQARCVPHVEGGRPAGYKCFQIVPGSIYDKIGMKNGDIIESINGTEINDPGQAFSLFSKLKTEPTVQITLKRNDRVITKTYDIQ